MDRFLMQISMEELSGEQELAMISRFMNDEPLETLDAVCEKNVLAELQEVCRNVYVHEELLDYMVRLIHATRKHSKVSTGVSPRGTLALVRASQAFAMVQGRDYVVPEDIKAIAVPVLAHRLSMSVAADGRKASRSVIEELLHTVELPTEDWSRR